MLENKIETSSLHPQSPTQLPKTLQARPPPHAQRYHARHSNHKKRIHPLLDSLTGQVAIKDDASDRNRPVERQEQDREWREGKQSVVREVCFRADKGQGGVEMNAEEYGCDGSAGSRWLCRC